MTQASVASAMSWSVSKLIRIETGSHTISQNDLKALLGHYQITDSEKVESLVEMAKHSKMASWLGAYRGIASDVFLAFLAHEDAAVTSYSFQPILVPGLLQTDEYATRVLQVTRGSKDPERINGLAELRLARQDRVFGRGNEITLNYLLDESVVRRHVGGRDAMRRQVSHLISSCELENLSIRIIPFSAGVYRSIRVPYVVLEFSNPEDESVLYLEYPQGESLIKEDGPFDDGAGTESSTPPTVPPTYLQIFAELHQQTSTEETMRILRSALDDLA
jgi:transcriptional regulator with XRE-family HTH domain